MTVEDEALVAAALAKGPEAFGPIVRRYQSAVFGVALARVSDFQKQKTLLSRCSWTPSCSLIDSKTLGAWAHGRLSYLDSSSWVTVDGRQVSDQVLTTTDKKQLKILSVLAALGLIQAWVFFDWNPSLSGDNAVFMILGRALATGRGLVHINNPGLPVETQFPPGFPALLAGVNLLYPGNLLAMKWFVSLLYALSIPLVYLLVSARESRVLAFVVAGFCLASAPLLSYSHAVMSEIPYMVASVGALLLLGRESGPRTSIWTVLAAVAAYYIRSVGITAIATVVLVLALRRQYRQAAIAGLGAVALVLPWVVYSSNQDGSTYIGALVQINAYRPELGYLTPQMLAERLFHNLKLYGLQVIPEVLLPYPFSSLDTSGYAAWMWALASACLGLVCYFLLFRRGCLAVRIYMALYAGVILLWPQIWSSMRFLIPVIPLILYASVWSVRALIGRWMPNRTAARVLIVLLCVATVSSNVFALSQLYSQKGKMTLEWHNYFMAAAWVRTHADPSAVVACRKPGLFYLVSGRRTVSYRFGDPREVMDGFRKDGVTLVVYDSLPFASTARHLTPALNAYAEQFDQVFRRQDPDTRVFAFRPKG